MQEDRLLWHQSVHEIAHEECSFFIFRFRSSSPSEVNQVLEQVLADQYIESYCLYMLFGHYDALLRVWARPDIRRRLVAALKELPVEIQALREMRVDSIHYRDSDPKVDEQLVDTYWPQIEEITRADHDNALLNDHHLHGVIDDLLLKSVVLTAPGLTADQLKVYFSIDSSVGSEPDATSVVTRLRTTFASFQPLAIYVGEGFGRFLVKGVGHSFSELSAVLPSIIDDLAREHLRCETFLVLGHRAPEADTIDAVLHSASSPAVARMLRAGGNKLDALVKRRTQDELEEVAKYFNEHAIGLMREDNELGSLAVDVVAAALKDDPWAISASLYYLSELEYFTREYLRRRALPQAFAGNWLDVLAVELETAISEGKSGFRSARELRDPGGWTLGNCVEIARLAMRLSAAFQSVVTTDLGANSIKLLDEAARQRNFVAHGRIYSQAGEPGRHIAFGKDAPLRLGTLLESLRLLRLLKAIVRPTQ
jgi:hypothetical protein